jgi:small-conductance mechanosensitive channel
MDKIWNYNIWNNTARDWTIALSIMIASIILLRIVQFIVIRKLKAVTARTKTTIDDFLIAVVQSSVMPLLYLLSVHFGLQYLKLPLQFERVERIAVMVIITFFFLRIVSSFITYSFKQALARHERNEQREKQSKGILLIVHVIIWCCGFLFLIDNLGYDITTLIAGLGIGGIAIALAAQTILGDLFSYLVIFFDKPFEIGDFIVVGTDMGTVEYIGIKTTRIRTLSGEQLVCSNTDLTNSRVHNFKRMQERRVVFSFGVIYSTPAEKLKRIPGMVRAIIESNENTKFDRAHFKAFGSSSLDFEVVLYIRSPDYNTYMDIQQQINLSIFEAFEKEHIEFAFPTQTLYVNTVNQEEIYGS